MRARCWTKCTRGRFTWISCWRFSREQWNAARTLRLVSVSLFHALSHTNTVCLLGRNHVGHHGCGKICRLFSWLEVDACPRPDSSCENLLLEFRSRTTIDSIFSPET